MCMRCTVLTCINSWIWTKGKNLKWKVFIKTLHYCIWNEVLKATECISLYKVPLYIVHRECSMFRFCPVHLQWQRVNLICALKLQQTNRMFYSHNLVCIIYTGTLLITSFIWMLPSWQISNGSNWTQKIYNILPYKNPMQHLYPLIWFEIELSRQ